MLIPLRNRDDLTDVEEITYIFFYYSPQSPQRKIPVLCELCGLCGKILLNTQRTLDYFANLPMIGSMIATRSFGFIAIDSVRSPQLKAEFARSKIPSSK